MDRRRMNSQVAPQLALAPAVAKLLEDQDKPDCVMLQKFSRYAEALLLPDSTALDAVVEADARLHDLEAMGMPAGLPGLKAFRGMINSAFPDERAELLRFELQGNDLVSAVLQATGTHRGELMGVPPSNRVARWLIHTRVRFQGEKVAERWDEVDVQELIGQLTR
jgi:predicted ester cyclase